MHNNEPPHNCLNAWTVNSRWPQHTRNHSMFTPKSSPPPSFRSAFMPHQGSPHNSAFCKQTQWFLYRLLYDTGGNHSVCTGVTVLSHPHALQSCWHCWKFRRRLCRSCVHWRGPHRQRRGVNPFQNSVRTPHGCAHRRVAARLARGPFCG